MSLYSNLPYIVHTKKSKYFADLIAKKLRYPLLPVIRKQFSDGEYYYKFTIQSKTALMGKDVIIVSAMIDDSELLELVRLGVELTELGTQRRIFCIPYLLYQTQSRARVPGEVVTCKSVVRMLSHISTGGYSNVFLLMDLHRFEIIHYFETAQALELYSFDSMCEMLAREIDFEHEKVIFGTADLGRPKWVERFSNHFGVGLVLCRAPKEYSEKTIETMKEPVGDVKDKHVVVYDDMIRSGNTLLSACEKYKEHGASKITVVVSHFAAFNAEVVEKIENSCISKLFITNSHVNSQWPCVKKSKKIEVIDISDVFVDQILSFVGKPEGPRSSSPLVLALD